MACLENAHPATNHVKPHHGFPIGSSITISTRRLETLTFPAGAFPLPKRLT
jgi:hypothetical protein